jgi:hypothetical protein
MSSSSRLMDTQTGTGLSQEFLVPPAMLDAVSPSGDRGGMMLGSGLQGEPLTISALRPAPTRIVLVGGLYMARQVALRPTRGTCCRRRPATVPTAGRRRSCRSAG